MTKNNKDNKNNRFIGEFTIIKNEEIAPQGIVKPFYHGGSGSGNFGHEGRPGERGGSAPGSGGTLSEGIARAVAEDHRRLYHGYAPGPGEKGRTVTTTETEFFVAHDGKVYTRKTLDTVPKEERPALISVHSHSAMNASPDEALDPFSAGDVYSLKESVARGYYEKMAVITKGGKMETLEVVDKQTLLKTTRAEMYSYDADVRGADARRAALHQFAPAHGMKYTTGLSWKETKEAEPLTHGGPGSGHFGHEGRPGERGESAPSGGGGHFDSAKWTKMPMDQRRDTWNKLSTGQRDRLADPVHSIPAREVELLKPVGSWPATKDIESDVGIRIGNAGDQLTEESKVAIHATMRGYMDALREAGVPDEKIEPLARAATDALLSQSMEAYTRQLGDHGIRHIEHDINTSMEILNSIPGEATPDRVAMLYTAAIWHDEGYLTEPSRVFLDEGHPRWSRDNFEENVGPMVANALGTSSVREISSTIRYHDATSMDWKEDALGSAMRVADNTALFQKDKMPPVFKYVPENTNTLIKLADGELDLDHAKATMHANIRKSDLSPVIRGRLDQAVEEITQYTPKATLGMLGGEMQGVEWRQDHPVVKLALSDQLTRLHKVADLGQNQFAKFAKAYDIDPKQFEHDLGFTFKDKAGTTLLEGEIAPGPLRSLAHLGWRQPVERYTPPGTPPRPDGFEPTTRAWRA